MQNAGINKPRAVKSGDVDINYQRSGKGNTTLLFLHGAYMNQTYWAEQVRYFSSHYQVITMDLPGHGQSGRNRDNWTIQQFGQDVVALLDQLDLHQVILVGHSMGAQAALEAAVSRPERIAGLVGIDMFKNAGTPLPDDVQQQVAQILQHMRTDLANTNEQYVHMALVTPQTESVTTRRVVADYRNAYQPMSVPMMEDVFNYDKRERELLTKLRKKLYLLNVDYRPTNEAPLKEYAGASYNLTILHGTSHFPMIENPAEFNRQLERTLQEIAREGSQH